MITSEGSLWLFYKEVTLFEKTAKVFTEWPEIERINA